MRSPWSWVDPHPIGLLSSQKDTGTQTSGEDGLCGQRQGDAWEPGTWVTTRSLREDPPEPCPDLRLEQGVRVSPLSLSRSVQRYATETRKH